MRKQASAENGVKILKANQDKYSISAMCKTLRDLRIYKNKTKIFYSIIDFVTKYNYGIIQYSIREAE